VAFVISWMHCVFGPDALPCSHQWLMNVVATRNQSWLDHIRVNCLKHWAI